jgi:hypothetical protein
MRRTIIWGVAVSAFVTGASCASAHHAQKPESGADGAPVRYAQKLEDEGVVAVPNNSTENRVQAIELIERHIGSDYQILSEGEVVKGSERKLENLSTESTAKEYQIHYRKRGVWRRGANSLPTLSLPVTGLGYVNRSEDKGVVALPDGSKKHREEGVELIERHLGSDYLIVQEGSHEAKYYIFYRKRGSIGWEPAWLSGPDGKTLPSWIKGGVY